MESLSGDKGVSDFQSSRSIFVSQSSSHSIHHYECLRFVSSDAQQSLTHPSIIYSLKQEERTNPLSHSSPRSEIGYHPFSHNSVTHIERQIASLEWNNALSWEDKRKDCYTIAAWFGAFPFIVGIHLFLPERWQFTPPAFPLINLIQKQTIASFV